MEGMNSPAPAKATKAPARQTSTKTNSTNELMKLVTKSVGASTKNTKTKISSAATKKAKIKSVKFMRMGGDNTAKGMVAKKINATSLGQNYIQGIVETSLADAPSVGADVNARLKRLSENIQPKLKTVIAGLNYKINKSSTGGASIATKKSKQQSPSKTQGSKKTSSMPSGHGM